ncbi:uncharacterized protein LOC127723983 [Mytilus californianus]|uniref:uncharacterized protein LOC127723983 n=1 Tax=Mytilus californianus TaxID=6549 RepID=UPI002245E4CA|nr:uncharacterized protein LOC127723983 [Mytilus californianus]XP_052086651.1 uncharacterized protein LOC127723983 [Mytilus californianus]
MAIEISKIFLISFILILVALLFELIGFSTPNYVTIDGGSLFEVNGGLWKRCTTVNSVKSCQDISGTVEEKDWFRACRAMSIFGFISLLVAAVLTGLKLFLLREMKPIFFASIGTTFSAAFFILVANSLYAANIDDVSVTGYTSNYGYSFGLSLTAMCIAVVAGIIMIVDLFIGTSLKKVQSN